MIHKLVLFISTKVRSFKTQLLLLFLLIGLIPLVGVSWYMYTKTVDTIIELQGEILENTAFINVDGLRKKFAEAEHDIEYWASIESRITFLDDINTAWKNSHQPLGVFVQSSAYKHLHDTHADSKKLINYKEHDDFVYDLMLIDVRGNILYTITKESDLGTNVLHGPNASTLFGQTVRKTLRDGKGYFSDLERYAPSNKLITSFITQPIRNEAGSILGVMVMQLSMPVMFESFAHKKGDKIINYLVGSDGLLRTSVDLPKEILKRSVHHEQFTKWHSEHVRGEGYTDDTVEEPTFYMGMHDYRVLGQHQAFEFRGVQWAHISEVSEKHVMGMSDVLLATALLFVIAFAVLIIFIAVQFSKYITKPIEALSEASVQYMHGNKAVHVEVKAGNELDDFSNVFNRMIATQNENEKNLKKLLNDLKEQKHALDFHSIVAITDTQGNITFVNKKFEELSGYTQEELIGQNHRILNSGMQPKSYWKDMYDTISSGDIWHDVVCNKAKNGHYYWVDTTIVPFMDDNNKPQSYIAIRSDLTERMKMEKELLIAKEAAEDSARSKSEFLAAMSHEIRTPMNGVLGMLGLLERSQLDNTQRHRVHVAQSSATSLLGLINDILDFSKIEAGKMDLENIEFNLRDELGAFTEAIAFRAEEKGLELILDTTQINVQNIIADPGRLRQIMTNLVGNAVKFTDQGQILIRVSSKNIDDQHGWLFVDVTDSGIGIPPEKIDTLFEAFTQADGSTTRKYGGTGLGLSIVKRLCELMGGSVKATSVPQQGSTFSIQVQVGLGGNSELPNPLRIAKYEQSEVIWPESTRILLVEDNTTNQLVAQGMLESIGLRADIAANGLEALESLQLAIEESAPYSLVLMDCQMPEMDGYTASMAIRAGKAGEANTTIPIVAMTANAMSGDREKCIISGMDDYISKPINLSVLTTTVMKWLLKDKAEIRSAPQETPEQTPSVTLPLWDEEDALQRLGNNSTLLNKIIELFMSDGKNSLVALEKALYDKNSEDAHLHAHSLKGSAGNVGALKLQNCAKHLEEAAKNNDLAEAEAVYNECKQILHETLVLFEAHLAKEVKPTVRKKYIDPLQMAIELQGLKEEIEDEAFVDTDKVGKKDY